MKNELLVIHYETCYSVTANWWLSCIQCMSRVICHVRECMQYVKNKIMWKVSSGWHKNYINYSLNNQNNILCYRRFDFTSEVFIRTDFRYRSSVCKSLSHTWLSWYLPSSRFMLSVFLIHIASFMCLPEVVYKIPCKNCERVYVGETGRPLGVRIKEHRKEVDSITGIFNRAEKTRASQCLQQICNYRSCLQWEPLIDWDKAKVIDRESDKSGRYIMEAIWIRKTDNMNRDEESYQLSHVWDKFLHTHHHHHHHFLYI